MPSALSKGRYPAPTLSTFTDGNIRATTAAAGATMVTAETEQAVEQLKFMTPEVGLSSETEHGVNGVELQPER